MLRDSNVKGATCQAARVVNTVQKMYEDVDKEVEEKILELLEENLLRHPIEGATKDQAAWHEAGHMAAYEAEGMVASVATIGGSPGGRAGWSGRAACLEPRLHYRLPYSAGDLLSEARAALAGPITEALHGDGDVFSSPGELIEARLLTGRAAQLNGREESDLWCETLLRTAAIVERCAGEIEGMKEQLKRRKRITLLEPTTQKILQRIHHVRTTFMSERGHELARLIETIMPFFDPFLETR